MNKVIFKTRILLLLLAIVGLQAANGYSRQPREQENGPDPRTQRLEELKQQAQQYASQIDRMLNECLKKINLNQRPDDAFVDSAAQTIEDCKKYAAAFDDPQKARFMLLQAWVYYFDGKAAGAVNWSSRACRTDPDNMDAWISQTLFCILNNKKPMERRIRQDEQRQQRQTAFSRRRNRNQEQGFEDSFMVQSSTSSQVLDCDLEILRKDFYNEKFARLSFMDVDGQKISYTPGQGILCLFFWQGEEKTDPNDVSSPTIARRTQPQKIQEPEKPLDPKYSLESQTVFFNYLYDTCKDREDITFIRINTNQLATAEKILNELPKDLSEHDSPPLVFAADPESGVQSYLGAGRVPFMAVVNETGNVIYAGYAETFMPAFVITGLSGVEIDLQKRKSSTVGGSLGAPLMLNDPMSNEMMFMEGIPMERPQQTVQPGVEAKKVAPDPNKPIADPNQPVKRPVKKSSTSDFPTQSIEDQIQAEKLLQAAELDIKQCRQVGGNPKEGIAAARKVLNEYPSYAQQARELLRLVPDRWKKQYNITDEELGY